MIGCILYNDSSIMPIASAFDVDFTEPVLCSKCSAAMVRREGAGWEVAVVYDCAKCRCAADYTPLFPLSKKEDSDTGGLCPECISGVIEGRGDFTCACGNVHTFDDSGDCDEAEGGAL